MYIEDIYNLNIGNQLALIKIDNVFYVSGCEFYQIKGKEYLTWIGLEQVHNLTICNCLFRNNDAQLPLIMIDSVSNVEIFGCEFYQNKDQDRCFVIFFHMDNCSNYGDDNYKRHYRTILCLIQILLPLIACSLITHVERTFLKLQIKIIHVKYKSYK